MLQHHYFAVISHIYEVVSLLLALTWAMLSSWDSLFFTFLLFCCFVLLLIFIEM